MTKISIITASLNRAGFVEQAIQNVLGQKVLNVEHLIIDGGSTDGSIEVYKRYPHLKVLVEADRNVYDAFNKGIALASGDVIGILNSDDLYMPGTLQLVLECFDSCSELEVVSGGGEYVKEGGSGEYVVVSRYTDKTFLELDTDMLLRQPPLVNGRFFRRVVFERLGTFDTNFPVVADREFMMRCAMAGLKNKKVESVFCRYFLHSDALSHKPEGVGGACASRKPRLRTLFYALSQNANGTAHACSLGGMECPAASY